MCIQKLASGWKRKRRGVLRREQKLASGWKRKRRGELRREEGQICVNVLFETLQVSNLRNGTHTVADKREVAAALECLCGGMPSVPCKAM